MTFFPALRYTPHKATSHFEEFASDLYKLQLLFFPFSLFRAILVFYSMLPGNFLMHSWHKLCNVDAIVKTVNLTNIDAVKLDRF